MTALLLWVVFRTVDVGAVTLLLSRLNLLWAAAALLLCALIIVSDATLLTAIMRMFARRVPFGTALLYSLVGWFFSNVAPSTVGGDIFRGVQLSRVGTPIGAAARIILSIRVLSLATLVAVMFAGFPIALELIEAPRDAAFLGGVLVTAAGAVGAMLLLAYFPLYSHKLEQWPLFRKFQTVSKDFRSLLVPSSQAAAAWFAALAQHLLRIGILAALAVALRLDIPITTLFALTPAALLVAMVPISFGGWGVREVAFVYLLGAAGTSAEAALTLSIAFGLLRIVVGAIGGVTWALMNDDHYRVDVSSA